MLRRYIFGFCLFLFLLFACKTGKTPYEDEAYYGAGDSVRSAYEPTPDIFYETQPVEINAYNYEDEYWHVETAPVYKGAETRRIDLIHTRLEIRFDWLKQQATGTAVLSFRTLNRQVDTGYIDAVGMDIRSVSVLKNGAFSTIAYSYDGKKIGVPLGEKGRPGEKFDLEIHYIAKPNEIVTETGEAIHDSKGLYFINPYGTKPGVPRQIWTQGEVQSTSAWLPTIDAPNEKMTHELFITVDDTLQTVSNGKLVKSAVSGPGQRTDHWLMNQPHAPYLVAMAIGRFHVESAKWKSVPLNYYTDPKYAGSSRTIFGNTPEMIEFFSNKLNYAYPWPKYDQVVVSEFVSGAMENTTVTIFGSMLHLDSRELLDADYEDVVAHELFHHWFGDLVTCESWAHLPLNEAFATYGEYLWKEYKYGPDFAAAHLHHDYEAYMNEALGKKEKLIRYDYETPLDMFDAHSYQKGALVLHMLRNYMGDTFFFAGLNLYLTTYAYKTAEVHDLRKCMEEVSNEDLTWFFDQWFFRPGHPYLEVRHEYDEDSHLYSLYVMQTHDAEYAGGYFRLPVSVTFHYEDSVHTETILIENQDHAFYWSLEKRPVWVSFDSDKMLLAEIAEYKPDDDWLAQLREGKQFKERLNAIVHIEEMSDPEYLFQACAVGMTDPYWEIRNRSMQLMARLDPERAMEFAPILTDHAENHPKAATRAQAFYTITDNPFDGLTKTIRKGLNDSSYVVNAAALGLLIKTDPEEGIEMAKRWALSDRSQLRYPALNLLADQTGDYSDIFIGAWEKEEGNKFYMIALISGYLKNTESPVAALRMLDFINGFQPKDEGDYFIVLFISQSNAQCKADWEGRLWEVEKQLEAETDPQTRKALETKRKQIKELLSIVMEF